MKSFTCIHISHITYYTNTCRFLMGIFCLQSLVQMFSTDWKSDAVTQSLFFFFLYQNKSNSEPIYFLWRLACYCHLTRREKDFHILFGLLNELGPQLRIQKGKKHKDKVNSAKHGSASMCSSYDTQCYSNFCVVSARR